MHRTHHEVGGAWLRNSYIRTELAWEVHFTANARRVNISRKSWISRAMALSIDAKQLEEVVFICDKCDSLFNSQEEIQQHFVTCYGLDQQIQSFGDAGERYQEATPTGAFNRKARKQENRCLTCDKVFATPYTLKSHMKLHNNDRPFKCDECGMGFALMSCLKTHMKCKHVGQTYRCQICGKALKSAHYLSIHLLIHKKEKEFKCDFCEKDFVDKPSLRLHLRSHTGDRPFKCQHCEKTFKQTSHLKTHERLHTDERPFKCDRCSKEFRQVGNLLVHKKTRHC